MEEKNIIGRKIRIARIMKKNVMRQKDLLAKLDLIGVHFSEATLSKIEAGTRFVKDYEVVAFAKALNVSANWLLGMDDEN